MHENKINEFFVASTLEELNYNQDEDNDDDSTRFFISTHESRKNLSSGAKPFCFLDIYLKKQV